jgi:hypothetical protein
VRWEFPTGKASKAGSIILAIIAFSYLVSGPFVMDPASTAPAQMSLHGKLHQFFGSIVFTLMPVSCFVFFRRFRADPRWQSFQWWTLAAGIYLVAALVFFSAGPTRPPAAPNQFNPFIGLIQRSEIIPFQIWLFAFALNVYRRIGSLDDGGVG